MDIELLKTFLEVSRTNHFGRAAESLFLTQSAVSFRIRQLETQLNTSLFTRHRNNIRLTSAGERLLPYAEKLLYTWKEAKEEVISSPKQRDLSIAASALLWECGLQEWLQHIYPKCVTPLDIRQMAFKEAIKLVRNHEIMLTLSTEIIKADDLCCEQTGVLPLQLYSTNKQLRQLPLPYIRVEWGDEFQLQEKNIFSQKKQAAITTASANLARQMLSITQSCAFLPTYWQQRYQNLILIENTPEITLPLYAIWHKDNPQPELIDSLCSIPLIPID